MFSLLFFLARLNPAQKKYGRSWIQPALPVTQPRTAVSTRELIHALHSRGLIKMSRRGKREELTWCWISLLGFWKMAGIRPSALGLPSSLFFSLLFPCFTVFFFLVPSFSASPLLCVFFFFSFPLFSLCSSFLVLCPIGWTSGLL